MSWICSPISSFLSSTISNPSTKVCCNLSSSNKLPHTGRLAQKFCNGYKCIDINGTGKNLNTQVGIKKLNQLIGSVVWMPEGFLFSSSQTTATELLMATSSARLRWGNTPIAAGAATSDRYFSTTWGGQGGQGGQGGRGGHEFCLVIEVFWVQICKNGPCRPLKQPPTRTGEQKDMNSISVFWSFFCFLPIPAHLAGFVSHLFLLISVPQQGSCEDKPEQTPVVPNKSCF